MGLELDKAKLESFFIEYCSCFVVKIRDNVSPIKERNITKRQKEILPSFARKQGLKSKSIPNPPTTPTVK